MIPSILDVTNFQLVTIFSFNYIYIKIYDIHVLLMLQ